MLGNKIFSSNTTISTEMIEPQLNDKVVEELNQAFEILINLSDKFDTKLVSGRSYFKHPETLKVIEEIDNILFKRFNIKTQHINGDGVGYAILTVPPVNLNIIAGDIQDKFLRYKHLLGKSDYRDEFSPRETTEKDVKEKKYIKDMFADEKSIIYHTYNSFLKLEDTLKSKGVKVDLKNAKIENLPKDYQLFVIADFYTLIKGLKITNEELTAILLHEVGHGFTHLEYSYRTVYNTSAILDSIREDLKKGKTPTNAFNLAYKNILKGEEDLNKYNESVATIKLIDRFMQNTLNMSKDDRHSFTDSEQLADQFANRFGQGDKLVTALNKMNEVNMPINPNTVLISALMVLVMILLTIVMLPAVLTYVISYTILTITFGGDDSNYTTYDKKLRRYKRIKNDMVRIIRTSSMDKKDMKRLLSEINIIDSIMDKASSDTTILDKIGDKLLPWNNKVSSFQKLEEMLEDMSENDLYIASNNLRTI